MPVRTVEAYFIWARSWADDGSGLPIWWQLQYFGHTGVDPYDDSDGDGWLNIQEFQNNTNPTVPNEPPVPAGLRVGCGRRQSCERSDYGLAVQAPLTAA